MIKIRSLVGINYDQMTAAFNDAFSDYAVPAHYTPEYLRDLVIRRGYRPDLALGAFDEGRLVGFVLPQGRNLLNPGRQPHPGRYRSSRNRQELSHGGGHCGRLQACPGRYPRWNFE